MSIEPVSSFAALAECLDVEAMPLDTLTTPFDEEVVPLDTLTLTSSVNEKIKSKIVLNTQLPLAITYHCEDAKINRVGNHSLYRFNCYDKKTLEKSIESSDLYDCSIPSHTLIVIDNLFKKNELDEMNHYLNECHFDSFSTSMSEVTDPDVFTKALFDKPSFDLFTSGLAVLDKAFQFLAYAADHCDAVASTHAWMNGSRPTFLENNVSYYYGEKKGLHRDFQTTSFGCSFPMCNGKGYYPPDFVNGAEGMPYLMTMLLYFTADNFDSKKHGMGTMIVDDEGHEHVIDCINGRILLGEMDAWHDLQNAKFEKGTVKTHRVSLNLLVCFRHKDPKCQGSIKQKMDQFLK